MLSKDGEVWRWIVNRDLHCGGVSILFLILLLVLAGGGLPGCGGGGGGSNPTRGAVAPEISNLYLSRTVLPFMEGGGTATLSAYFNYYDPEADIVSVRVEVSDGTSLDIPLGGPLPSTSGMIYGTIELSTATCGVFVAQVWAVDSGGLASNILLSDVTVAVDVANWTSRTSPTTSTLLDITWSGSKFVAVGMAGVIVTSNDGVNWVSRDSGFNTPLAAVIWDGSQFVVVGGIVLTSADGIAWTGHPAGPDADDLNAVAWSGSIYVTGGSLSGDTRMLWSDDAVTWHATTSLILPNRTITDIAWSGTRFVATARFLSSSNAATTVMTSTDGLNWNESVVTNGSVSLLSICWTGSQFMAAGAGGDVFSSPDGITWTTYDATSFWLYSTASNGSDFLAGGTGGIVGTFDDGLTWNHGDTLSTIRGLVWGGDKFVAVGGTGRIYTAP